MPSSYQDTIRELLVSDRNPRQEMAASQLTAEECRHLKEIVRRKSVSTEPHSMSKAISALVRSEPSPDVCRILGKFLADERNSVADRAVAAINLRLVPGREAQEALIANLRAYNPQVQRQVIKSLGSFGDEEALKALNKLIEPRFEAGRKQLAFAKALIAHRINSPKDYLPFREGVVRERGREKEMIALSLRPLLKPIVQSQRQFLQGTTYGIDIGEVGFELTAGKARWTVFVNQALGVGEGYGKLFQRKWITALLAHWDPQTNSAAVQYVVLTGGKGDTAEIIVVRTDGEIFYTGEMARTEGVMSFAMRDVMRSGTAPTNVAGNLTPQGVELTLTIPFGSRVDAKTGEEVTVKPHRA